MRGYHCLPSSLQEKKPSLNHNISDLCSCLLHYCSFLPHPLLSAPSGTLWSLTQLHWSPSSHTLIRLHLLTPVRVTFGSVHSFAHGLWLCTVEWFIRYCTLPKCINSLKHPGGVLLVEPCFMVKSLLVLLGHLRGWYTIHISHPLYAADAAPCIDFFIM